jgi:small subunit ribosomal protein S17
MANTRRRLTGEVVSNKMSKTVVVRVQRSFRHPLYGKTVYSSKKYMAHDESNACEIGDEVVMVESRPLSKNKRWVVERIVREDESKRATVLDTVAAIPGVVADAAETVASATVDAVEAVADVAKGAAKKVAKTAKKAAKAVEEAIEGDDDDADEDGDE